MAWQEEEDEKREAAHSQKLLSHVCQEIVFIFPSQVLSFSSLANAKNLNTY
jgi:hypothetical protein